MTYYPLMKTTPSELKALEHVIQKFDQKRMIPFLLLTKPRISNSPNETLENHINKILRQVGNKRKVIIGITEDEKFQDANLTQYILDTSDGYFSWRNRLNEIKKLNDQIIPSVIGYPNADNIKDYRKQISLLSEDYNQVAIKLPSSLDDDFKDIRTLFETIGLSLNEKNNLIFFDFSYIESDELEIFKRTLDKLNREIGNIPSIKATFIILFSSCPASFPIQQRSIRESGKIRSLEMIEYKVADEIQNKYLKLKYGDYAYIHPYRSDSGGIVWYPRIDYPSENSDVCYYARFFNKNAERINGDLKIITTISNEEAYRELSKRIVAEDFFINDKIASWGKEEILCNTKNNSKIGKSPSHYISIRSNIHMNKILSLISKTSL